jgi:hypothetical protein
MLVWDVFLGSTSLTHRQKKSPCELGELLAFTAALVGSLDAAEGQGRRVVEQLKQNQSVGVHDMSAKVRYTALLEVNLNDTKRY